MKFFLKFKAFNFRIKDKVEIGENIEELAPEEHFRPTSIRLGNDDTSSSDDSEEDESMSDFIDDTGVQSESTFNFFKKF